MPRRRTICLNIVTSLDHISADLVTFADKILADPHAIIFDENRQPAVATLERRRDANPQEAELAVASLEAD